MIRETSHWVTVGIFCRISLLGHFESSFEIPILVKTEKDAYMF